MVEVESATFQLGEREFTVPQAGFLRAKPWKKRLFEEIKPIVEQVGGVTGIEFSSPADLLRLVPTVETLFLDGIDTMFDLLVSYSPLLEAERDYIAEYATDKQILAAFQEVVKLTDPFGMVANLNQLAGRRAIGTSSSLQSANGISA